MVELDGSQHYEESGREYDARRTRFLNAQGLKVLRFTNTEVKTNLPGICRVIDREVRQNLPLGEGGRP